MTVRTASEKLAIDRSSVRTVDPQSGHMHVAASRISKATVNPYYGNEIPRFEELGLDPGKVYQLYRDPDELAKAAPTFAGKPLLMIHKASTADDHPREVVVGSVGSNVSFDAPYLVADLNVWDGEAIAGIESGEQRELSCGYGYDAVLQDGEADGQKYSIVMTNIHGNHVALVVEGRAGPEVLVGDNQLRRNPVIKTKALPSRKALLVQGALSALLAPKLAADAKIDLGPMLQGVNRANFKAQKANIAKAVGVAVKGKLAQDGDLGEIVENVAELLDNLNVVENGEADEDDLSQDVDETEEEKKAREEKEAAARDADGPDADAICAALKGKVDDETLAKIEAALKPAAADAEGEKDDKEPPITKAAMDKAIAAASVVATTAARTAARKDAKDLHDAETAVQPYVGQVVGMDSAEAVYRFAIEKTNPDIALDGLPASALPAILKALPVPGANRTVRIAADSAANAEAEFKKMFPDAKPLVRS